MQSTLGLDQTKPTALSDDVTPSSGSGRILSGVFEVLDRAGIPYCVLHGYENYPQHVKSDVDCAIPGEVGSRQLAALFHDNRARIGAELVHYPGYYFVFAGKNADGSPCFLTFDVKVDYTLDDRHFCSGDDILQSRRRHKKFWVPAPNLEFGCYLVRKINKGSLDDEQGARLSKLYQQDPAGCREQVARFWRARSTALIISAAHSGNWELVRHSLGRLRTELRGRAVMRHPLRTISNWLRRVGGRTRRCFSRWTLGGVNVVFLGPDGAGKSSVIQSAGQALIDAFHRKTCYSFPPALLRCLSRSPEVINTEPHASPPRSFISSAVRAVFYWFVYSTIGYYLTVRMALARSTLVMHDRHLVDALVDPRRYRYAGPQWILRLIWRLVPKPDLVILLDAPVEVLRARKQEVSYEETVRQRAAYASLVRTMNFGVVVNAARPMEEVASDVNEIILRYQRTRIARHLGFEQHV